MPTISGLSKRLGTAVVPGGPIGEIKVPGDIKAGDTLLDVLEVTDGAPPVRVNRTAECSITAGKAGSITTTVTNTTGKYLLVIWTKAD